jgi:RNA polymerase sigma-70 factor, ECF subfamily
MDILRGEMDRLIGERGTQDPAVIEAMLSEYGAAVYRLALSILRDPADAQDAAQETFTRAAAALHRYQVGTNFKAWLFQIAINNCRISLRKRSPRHTLQQAWTSLTSAAPRPPDAEAQVVKAETRRELWSLVDALDDKHRLVVVLRLAHNLSIREVSQALGIGEKTVYTRLYNALKRLRGQIEMSPEYAHLRDEVQS